MVYLIQRAYWRTKDGYWHLKWSLVPPGRYNEVTTCRFRMTKQAHVVAFRAMTDAYKPITESTQIVTAGAYVGRLFAEYQNETRLGWLCEAIMSGELEWVVCP